MPFWIQIFAVAVASMTLLSLLVFRSPAPFARKLAALAILAVFLPAMWAGTAELLGRPKPVGLEWWRDGGSSATLLGSRIEEGRAIYLWLLLDGEPEPRSYALPWSRSLAEALLQAERQAEANGTGVMVRRPFEPSLDDREPMFHALPQPALPPKDVLEPPPEIVAPGEAA